ncbi:MAG: hypothetical protein ACYTGV_02345 [Planctomycetota bacterium]|jgi:hypothetical protein
MSSDATAALQELESLKYDFGAEATARKVELLLLLERRRLPDSDSVHSFHELLCFLRAYPETAGLLEIAERIVTRFDARSDLRHHRRSLADTGIAGTVIHFRFFWLTAIWLARRWPKCLTIEWREFEHKGKLEGFLHLLLPYSESPVLDAFGHTPQGWLRSLKGPEETDAAFLIRRYQALKVETPLREKIYEDLDIPMVLSPGPTTPARSRERWEKSPIVFQEKPPARSRPNLRRAIGQAMPRVRPVDPKEGRRLIDLANGCMVPRHRDLLIFLYADEKDVRMVDFGDGLQLACMGAVPERRLVLESVYGCLTLMNGVPIGYVLCSAFFNSSEVAYNVFETFRGAGAAQVYARVLATIGQLFGADTFALDPYQLGHGNREGQESGAWWFYYKLGFRPHDPGVRAMVREELAKMKSNPRHRTSIDRLDEMASEYMFLHLGPSRRDVLGHIDLGNIGAHISRYLAQRFGGLREQGIATCAEEAARLLGLRRPGALTPGERLAWKRWAPLVLTLPGVRRWTPAQKRALRDVIRAKGGRRETDFVRLFDRHPRLRRALLRLSEDEVED